jgi:predicted enzyme related to lactoylglutathione lyase
VGRPEEAIHEMLLGLRSAMYPAADLEASKAWFSELLGIPPYFDEPFYVGFNVGGYELGLVPETDAEATVYWGVPDADVALAELVAAGATVHSDVTDVGEGIRVATVREPGGSILGVIENPQFVLSPLKAATPGPGR